MSSNSFESDVLAILRALKPGDLITYGEVAAESGHPGAARAVGRILANSEGLAWWRVITASGRLVPGHEDEQAKLLATEGTATSNGRILRTK